MKNNIIKIIVTTVYVLSISMLPLSGPATPAPCPPEPYESASGNVCEPLNDNLEIEYGNI